MSRDFDSPWKEGLDAALDGYLRILLPELHAEVDWSVPYQSLDTELQQIVSEAELGPTQADKLFRVRLRSGGEHWILIHVEVQAQVDARFARRMFLYSCRIRERYNQFPESIALLADERPGWRPTQYREQNRTAQVVFDFTAVKLLDWLDRQGELEADPSPVGVLIVAHLQSQATEHDPAARRVAKVRLFRQLLARLNKGPQVRQFLRLVDWFLNLPPEEKTQFFREIETEDPTMPGGFAPGGELEFLFKQGELKGREEGLQEGREEGRQAGRGEALLWLIERTYGPAATPLLDALRRRPWAEWVDAVQARFDRSPGPTLDELLTEWA